MDHSIKNNAESLVKETHIEDGFYVLRLQNETTDSKQFIREVSRDFIQFHFCVKGAAQLAFNDGGYQLPLHEEHSILLYNPQRDLPMDLTIEKDSWVVSVLIPIKKFHSLFSPHWQKIILYQFKYSILFLGNTAFRRPPRRTAPLRPTRAGVGLWFHVAVVRAE